MAHLVADGRLFLERTPEELDPHAHGPGVRRLGHEAHLGGHDRGDEVVGLLVVGVAVAL